MNKLTIYRAQYASCLSCLSAFAFILKTQHSHATVQSELRQANPAAFRELIKHQMSNDQSANKPFLTYFKELNDRLKALEKVNTFTEEDADTAMQQAIDELQKLQAKTAEQISAFKSDLQGLRAEVDTSMAASQKDAVRAADSLRKELATKLETLAKEQRQDRSDVSARFSAQDRALEKQMKELQEQVSWRQAELRDRLNFHENPDHGRAAWLQECSSGSQHLREARQPCSASSSLGRQPWLNLWSERGDEEASERQSSSAQQAAARRSKPDSQRPVQEPTFDRMLQQNRRLFKQSLVQIG